MIVNYVIQNLITKEYYWRGRTDEGFSSYIHDATIFNTEQEAEEELSKEYLISIFDDSCLGIIKYYKI